MSAQHKPATMLVVLETGKTIAERVVFCPLCGIEVRWGDQPEDTWWVCEGTFLQPVRPEPPFEEPTRDPADAPPVCTSLLERLRAITHTGQP